MQLVLDIASAIAIVFVVLIFGVYIFLTIRAGVLFPHKKSVNVYRDLTNIHPKQQPRVALLVPAYNESLTIAKTLDTIFLQTYQGHTQIIIVDDGSEDSSQLQQTIHTSCLFYGLARRNYGSEKLGVFIEKMTVTNRHLFNEDEEHEFRSITKWMGRKEGGADISVTLIKQPNMGKSVALNKAICLMDSQIDFAYTIDADTTLDLKAIKRTVECFNADKYDAMSAMVSITDNTITSGEFNSTPKLQVQMMEYIRSFLLWKIGIGNEALVITGAFAMFKAKTITEIGYIRDTLGEDFIISLSVWERGGRVQSHNEVLAYTQPPKTWSELNNQRVRWFRGGLDCLIRKRKMLFNKKQDRKLSYLLLPFLYVADIAGLWVEVVLLLIAGTAYAFFPELSYDGFLAFLGIVAGLHILQMHLLLFYAYPRTVKNKLKKRYRVLPIVWLEVVTYHYVHLKNMIVAHLREYFNTEKKWNKVERY